MILYEGLGDLFNCDAQTIACPINTIGAMGKGLALQFRDNVPGLYDFYRRSYGTSKLGAEARANHLEVFTVPDGRKVLLFPTKVDWRDPSTVHQIHANLITLAQTYQNFGITSLAIPALGCGLGGLNYDRDVRPLVHDHLGLNCPLPVQVLFSHDTRTRW